MADILLDYVLKVDIATAPANADLSYLRKVLAIVKPKSGVTGGTIETCTTSAEISAITDNADTVKLLIGGLCSIYVLAIPSTDDLSDVGDLIESNLSDFFSIAISSDFSDAEYALLDVGSFKGVVYAYSNDKTVCASIASTNNSVGFYDSSTNKAKNLFYAIGHFLAQATWKNNQYLDMPENSDVILLGDADLLFDDRISFVINSPEYGNKLALFACGGKAIIYPYVVENLRVSLQSRALQVFALNNPKYTITDATLLEDKLQDVINFFITQDYITTGSIKIELGLEQFIAIGTASIDEPSAMWRTKIDLTVGG